MAVVVYAMFRRALNLVLLLAGVGLLTCVLREPGLAPRHLSAILLLLAVGLTMNLVGLLRQTLSLRPWLRVLAVLVGLASLVGVAGIRWATQSGFATVSRNDIVLRERFAQAVHGSTWLAAGLAHVIVSAVVLPRYAPPTSTPGSAVGNAGVRQ